MLKGKVEGLHTGTRAGAFGNVSMFTRCSEAAGTAERAHCCAAQRSDHSITQALLVAELLCVSPALSCCPLPEAVCSCSAHKMGFPQNFSLVALQQTTCPVQGLLYSLQPDRLISPEQLPPSQLGSLSPLCSFPAHLLLAPQGYGSYFTGRLSYSSHASCSGPCDLLAKSRAGFTAQLLTVWEGADFKHHRCTLKIRVGEAQYIQLLCCTQVLPRAAFPMLSLSYFPRLPLFPVSRTNPHIFV